MRLAANVCKETEAVVQAGGVSGNQWMHVERIQLAVIRRIQPNGDRPKAARVARPSSLDNSRSNPSG